MPVEQPQTQHAWWMYTPLLDVGCPDVRAEVIPHMATLGVDARPIVFPIHLMPPYAADAGGERFPIAERLAAQGINLPTFAGLTRDEVRRVADALRSAIRQ